MVDQEKPSIRTIVLKWSGDHGDKFGTIPFQKRKDALGLLFTSIRMHGYTAEDLTVYENQIKRCLYPSSAYKGAKKKQWIALADADYNKALSEYLINGEVVMSKTIEPLPRSELPQVEEQEEEFVRMSKPLDRKLIPNTAIGAAEYKPDKEFCDYLGVPEDHRE